MTLKRLLIVVCLLAAAGSPALAQLTDLPDTTSFSSDAFGLDFKFFPPQDIVGPGHTLSAWGVHFTGSTSSCPEIRGVVTSNFPTPVMEAVLRNPGAGQLVIDLARPATRVGLWLGNGTESSDFTITAYDSKAALIGSLDKTGLPAVANYVGVEAPPGPQISKLVIAYENAEEEVHRLLIDYEARDAFRVVLPQIADGPVGAQAFVTTVVISNVSNTTSAGELRLFSSSADTTPAPLTLSLTGPSGLQTASVFPFTLPPFTSITFVSQGVGNISVGYAVVSAEAPVEGTAIFTTINGDGTVFREAGVGSNGGLLVATGAVLKSGNLDSGVAAVNTSLTDSVDSKVELFDAAGNLVATNEDILDLAPGGHIAKFLGELFPGVVGASFQGSIVITADQPIAPAILRAVDGLVSSSLPVGSTQRN